MYIAWLDGISCVDYFHCKRYEFEQEQEGGSLVTHMALAYPFYHFKNRSRNKR